MHKFSGEYRPELQDSPPQGLARDIHPLAQQGCDVTIAKRESEKEPDGVSNHLRWESLPQTRSSWAILPRQPDACGATGERILLGPAALSNPNNFLNG